MVKKTKVGIIGSGLSGLTIGYLLKQKGIEVQIFERSHRTGGTIGTKSESGFLVEFGANSFLNNEPKTLDLIKLLNLDNQVIKTKAEAADRYIYINNHLHKVPLNLKDFWNSKIISYKTKFSVWLESKFPPHIKESPNTRTIYDFGKDHFGEEFAENILRPMMVGIFGGDAKKLSLNMALPRFQKAEQEHKSLLRAMGKSEKPQSLSFKNGLQTLIDSLTKQLSENIVLNSSVTDVENVKNKFIVHYQDEVESESFSDEFQEIIICIPTTAMPEVLSNILDKTILQKIDKFPTAPIKTISIAFSEPLKFKGFGALVSPQEDLKILGFIHPKDLFDNRCPANKDLVTVMMGGTFQPLAVNWSLQNALKIAVEGLTKILGPLPQIEKYWMWNHAPGIPQYDVESLGVLNEIETHFKSKKGISLHSTLSGGVAINDCIRKSFLLAEQFNPEHFQTEWVPDQSPEDDEAF